MMANDGGVFLSFGISGYSIGPGWIPDRDIGVQSHDKGRSEAYFYSRMHLQENYEWNYIHLKKDLTWDLRVMGVGVWIYSML